MQHQLKLNYKRYMGKNKKTLSHTMGKIKWEITFLKCKAIANKEFLFYKIISYYKQQHNYHKFYHMKISHWANKFTCQHTNYHNTTTTHREYLPSLKTASVTWYKHCKRVCTKILQNFYLIQVLWLLFITLEISQKKHQLYLDRKITNAPL